MFANPVPDLIAEGASVIIECGERLVDVFWRHFLGPLWWRELIHQTLLLNRQGSIIRRQWDHYVSAIERVKNSF